MYLDCSIELYQVTKNLFNVELRIYDESGTEVKFKRWDRLSWTNALGMCRAAYLSTRATLGAKNLREQSGGEPPFQEELPF